VTLRVGTAGVPNSAREANTFSGVERIRELGLDHLEVAFTHGVRMGKETARELGAHAKKFDVSLTIHAPYWINLNSSHARKIKDSEERILATVERAALMGAASVAVHIGFYGKDGNAYSTFRQECDDLLETIEENGWAEVRVSPETMGRHSQFGTVKEHVELCRDVEGLGMTYDWGHVCARANGNPDYAGDFGLIEKELGREFLRGMHMHAEGIEWTANGGERRHLNMADAKGPGFEPIVSTIKDFKIGGFLVCESPNLEVDALEFKRRLSKLGVE
jgi:deoxyribonuclease-4